jgi:hypothetical protein
MIILITGKKYSGKDEAAKILVEDLGFISYSFAHPIKKAAEHIFLFDYEQLYGDKKEKIDKYWGISPREFFQIFGTEIMQYDFGKYIDKFEKINGREIWVKRFHKWFTMYCDNYTNVVIPDLRFLHESNYLIKNFQTDKRKVYIIRINRNSKTNKYSNHLSENEIDKININYEIDNNESIEELKNSILKIYNNIKEKENGKS